MEQIRAFIALELPKEVKAVLSRLLSQLRAGQERAVKWVDPDGIHLTLKFLGNIPGEKVSAIAEAMKETASEVQPYTLALQELGAFPNLRSPRVVWIGVGGEVSRIATIQKQIDQALAHLGFAPETKEFSPHLTLGRVRDQATSRERSDLGRLLDATKTKEQIAFEVDRIHLMKSTLTPGGPIYNCLASISLDRERRKC
ncbi:MAG: RNA 2',3'-cyclic phosphodiesterase [Dehalococcoidia bacterium]|nr:RNA 2',3'-cyclic phosphodiesterase [Dehalococcoidia bacterium]